ncbi:hypothetical protein [Trichothermofontia sp.]
MSIVVAVAAKQDVGINPVGFGQFADHFGKVAHPAWMADDPRPCTMRAGCP